MLPAADVLLHFSEDPGIRLPAARRGLHAVHGIELLVLDRLEEHLADVQHAGHEFSAIRMRNGGLGPSAFA